jgi:hypothetical protein
MNKDVAREIIRAAFRSGSELEGLISILKANCAADDYKFFLRQIAMAIDGIHTALVNEAVKRFPELEAEMASNVARTGRVMP